MSASVFGSGGMSQAQVGALMHPGFTTPGYAFAANVPLANGTPTFVDRVSCYLYFNPRERTIGSIYCRVATGGAGSAIKFALVRAHPTTGRPDGLPVVGSNTGLDTTVSSSTPEQAITPVVLPIGWYWVLSTCTGTLPSVAGISTVSGMSAFMSGATATGIQVGTTGLYVSDAYANDIMSFNATGQSWLATIGPIPAPGLGYV